MHVCYPCMAERYGAAALFHAGDTRAFASAEDGTGLCRTLPAWLCTGGHVHVQVRTRGSPNSSTRHDVASRRCCCNARIRAWDCNAIDLLCLQTLAALHRLHRTTVLASRTHGAWHPALHHIRYSTRPYAGILSPRQFRNARILYSCT